MRGRGESGKVLKILWLVAWVGPDQIKKEELFSFSHPENGIAGYNHFYDPLPLDRVYRVFGVLSAVLM